MIQDLLNEYADELLDLASSDEPDLRRARTILVANSLRNLASEIQGSPATHKRRGGSMWWAD